MRHHNLFAKATAWNLASRYPLVLLTVVGAACSEAATGTLPTLPAPLTPVPTPAPVPGFPPLSRPGTVYDRTSPSAFGPSRYVLFEDSTFALQYKTGAFGFAEYKGRYGRTGTELHLLFDGNHETWYASAKAEGDSLVVKYSDFMVGSDFENGVYRSRGQPTIAGHIYLVDSSGFNLIRLVAGSWPAWSPDERQIAFQREGYIHVIDVDGANEIRLEKGAFPAWSPDGTRLAFTNSEGMAVMNADGSSVTTLIRRDFAGGLDEAIGIGKPSWSPDGRRIAFEHFGDGEMTPAQIYVMNADGSKPQLLTATSGGRRYAESDPSWSPDGSNIAFWSYGYGIATVSASGGQPSSIYANFPTVAYGTRPTFSPDGKALAFTAGKFASNKPMIWTTAVTRGSPKVIANGFDAAWPARTGKIAFVAAGDG